MKRLAAFATTFLFICLCGLFVAAAGGIVWGTHEAGGVAFLTIFLAFCIGVATVDAL